MAKIHKTNHRRVYFKEWRKFRGLTQMQAAERLECDQATVSRLENQAIPYDRDILERMVIAYGCHEPADLLTINPLAPDPPRMVYSQLRSMNKPAQDRATAILDALLKAG